MPDPIPTPSGIQIHSPSLGEGGETTPYQGSRLWDALTLKSSQTHTDLLPLPSLPQNPRTPPGPQTHTIQGPGPRAWPTQHQEGLNRQLASPPETQARGS